MELSVKLGRLQLPNPIMVASGTFGNVEEFAELIDVGRLGAVIPKTITMQARRGNPPPRTVETPSGLLNSIGLDNDGLDHFLDHHLPALDRFFHYRSIDVSSLKELCRRWYPQVYRRRPPKRDRHRARDDIHESIAELRFYRDELFRPAGPPGRPAAPIREAGGPAQGTGSGTG